MAPGVQDRSSSVESSPRKLIFFFCFVWRDLLSFGFFFFCFANRREAYFFFVDLQRASKSTHWGSVQLMRKVLISRHCR